MTNDRFHVQKLFYEAIDELHISYRWTARDFENDKIQRCRKRNIEYVSFRHTNGDTRKQLPARAKHVLVKHFTKWTESQKIRAEIIFDFYPELKSVYNPALKSTNIYNKNYNKDVARAKLALWYNKIEQLRYGCFRTVANTMQSYYKAILNYFVNRETNAFAESFNAKIKAFRALFRGVGYIPFFILDYACKLLTCQPEFRIDPIKHLHTKMEHLPEQHSRQLQNMKEARRQEVEVQNREISRLGNIIAKVFQWFPVLRETLRMEKFCKLIGFTQESTDILVTK